MNNGLAPADYAVISSFFVVMISIGIYFKSRVGSMSDFFGGGKQVPWWLAGISFYMCTFSALGFVMYSALAYQYGWVSVTIWWASIPSIFLTARLFASRWRRVAETSPLEYIEHRYGNKMRQSLIWLGLPTRILDDGLKLLAIGTVVAVGMGFPPHYFKWVVIGSGIIMISYTFMGGLWATLVADFIQFVVLVAAVVVLPFLTFQKAGGISAFIEKAPEGFFNLTSVEYPWVYIIIVVTLSSVLNYGTSWALVQRYYSVDSDKNARKVGYLVALLNVIGPPIFYIPAMAARTFISGITNYNEVYPIVCKAVLPIGMLGMVIAAMFAATMSMVAGDFNAAASVLTNDLYKRMFARGASTRRLLLVSRVNTLIVGVIVIGVTFLLRTAQGAEDLVRLMFKIFGLFLPPVAVPMLFGMLTKRISGRGGLVGLFVGITAGLIAFVLAQWRYPILLYEPVIFSITAVTTLISMFIGTAIFPDDSERKEKVLEFFKKIDTPSPVVQPDAETAAGKQGVSPLPIIGFGVIVIGIVLLISVLVTVGLAESKLSSSVGACITVVGLFFLLLDRRLKKKSLNSS